MSYYLVPMGYDEDDGHAVALECDLPRTWPSLTLAEAAARAMVDTVPDCVLVRITQGERLLKEVKR